MELEQYEAVLTATQAKIAAVKPEQYGAPTPCTDWDVKAVLNHLVGGHYWMAGVLAGSPPDASGGAPDLLGADAAAAYGEGAKLVLAAFSEPGVLEKAHQTPMGPMPGAALQGIHFMDQIVHTWDLAKATGGDASIPEPLAQRLLEGAQGMPDFPRDGSIFGPKVDVPADAPASHRLLGFTGRQP